jgi:hypothetical protein
MLLLLKINEFLRNIDRRMGSPMNNFENMMKYIYVEIKKIDKSRSFYENLMLDLEYYKYMFFFSTFHVYQSFSNLFFKSKEEKEEEQNAEMVFEYLH